MGTITSLSSAFNSFSTATLSPNLAAVILLGVVFILWAIYTLIAIYHWTRYSHAALIAFPSIAVHLVVSAILITFAWGGLLAL